MVKFIALAVVVLASLCVSTYGHGWMVRPTPANFQGDTQASASQDKPCGFGIGPENITLPKYGNIDSAFTIGGGHNTAPCTVALATIVNETAFDQNIMWQWECKSPSSHDKSFFITENPGTYYMRWRWSSWLACAQVVVTAPEITVSPMNVGDQKTGNVAASSKQYYELSIEPNKFVLLEFTGPADTTFGASQNQLPTASSADVLVTSSGDGSLCSSSEYSTAIVAAFGGSSTGSYSIKADTYNGILDYVNDPDQDMSVPKATTRIVATDAFDNSKAKRIVVRKTGGSGDVGITAMGTDCSASVSQPQSLGSNACVNVGTNQNRKYYKIYTTDAVDFTAKVEDGTCSSFNAGVANNASLLFLIASFIVAMF